MDTPAVLIVEGQRFLAELLQRALERPEREVFVASDAPQARDLAALIGDRLAVVVTETALPSERGDVLARGLVGDRDDVRVILLSADPGKEAEPPPGRAGRFLVIGKPFNVWRVQRLVADCLLHPRGAVARLAP